MRNLYILTRYYFPHPAIDSECVYRMVRNLSARLPETRITVCHLDAPYKTDKWPRRKPLGRILKLRPSVNTGHRIGRFAGNLVDGYRMIRSVYREADAVICLTNPALITYWAGRMLSRRQIPWAGWTFDLYPYLFTAAGIVGEENVIYRYLMRSMERNHPDLVISLGEGQADFIRRRCARPASNVVLPCGIHDDVAGSTRPLWCEDDNKIYFAYTGNLGEAHSPDFLIDFINCLDEKKHVCLLAIYGSKAEKVLKALKNRAVVKVMDWIDREEMFHVDVHLVTLLSKWTHMSVPSKAVSAICYGGAMLFNGSEESDTWRMLNRAGWLIKDNGSGADRKERIRSVLSLISDGNELAKRKAAAAELKSELLAAEENAYKSIAAWVNSAIREKG